MQMNNKILSIIIITIIIIIKYDMLDCLVCFLSIQVSNSTEEYFDSVSSTE